MDLNVDSRLVEFVITYNPISKESNSMDLYGDSFVVEFVIADLIKEISIHQLRLIQNILALQLIKKGDDFSDDCIIK